MLVEHELGQDCFKMKRPHPPLGTYEAHILQYSEKSLSSAHIDEDQIIEERVMVVW